MKALELNQMESINGGDIATIAGGACGLAVSGLFFGGFGGVVTGLMFGPSCVSATIGAIYAE